MGAGDESATKVYQTAVIDRIVQGRGGRVAVLLVGHEEREYIVPTEQLPQTAGEGMWLRVRLDGERLTHAKIDAKATKAARGGIANKMEKLRRRDRKIKQTNEE